ncbi:hypothetical protein BDZ89DRAFT_1128921 [Hymenopellis radicata]|nr:hypothetical protein BDZ89DRAFT_1128921 [Hymenopellis radicata]
MHDVMFQLQSVVRGLQSSFETLDLRIGPSLNAPVELVSVIPPYTQSPSIQLGFSVEFWSPENGRGTEWPINVLSSLDPTVSIPKLEVFLQFDSPVHPSSIPFICTSFDSSHDTSESWKPIDRALTTTPAAIDHLVIQMLYFPDRNAKWRGSGNLAERAEEWLFSVCLPLTKEKGLRYRRREGQG